MYYIIDIGCYSYRLGGIAGLIFGYGGSWFTTREGRARLTNYPYPLRENRDTWARAQATRPHARPSLHTTQLAATYNSNRVPSSDLGGERGLRG